MKHIAFGYAWWGVTLLSFCLAELWLGFWQSFTDVMPEDQAALTEFTGTVTYWVMTVMYSSYLLKVLYVRVPKIVYIVFLLGRSFLILVVLIKCFGLYVFMTGIDTDLSLIHI